MNDVPPVRRPRPNHAAPKRRRRALVIGSIATAALALAALPLLGEGEQPPSARLDDGLAAHAAGDVDAARSAYEDVLEQDPANKFAHYNIGVIAQAQGDTDSADAAYRAALAADPAYVPALFNLAVLRYEAGDFEQAIDLYTELLAVDELDAGAHLNLGYALLSAGRTEAANAEFDRATELDPALGPPSTTAP